MNGEWSVAEVDGLFELHERIHKTACIKLFGTETPDYRSLARIAELHNQCVLDLLSSRADSND